MVKEIKKIGNSKGIILDSAILEMAHLKEGDKVNVAVHEGGAITLTPTSPRHIADEKFDAEVDSVLEDYTETLKKLS